MRQHQVDDRVAVGRHARRGANVGERQGERVPASGTRNHDRRTVKVLLIEQNVEVGRTIGDVQSAGEAAPEVALVLLRNDSVAVPGKSAMLTAPPRPGDATSSRTATEVH